MSNYRIIEEKLRGSGRVLLDGATGTELERRGVPMHVNDVISPEDYADEAGRWLALGARLLGGCCGIGPEHIKELKRRYEF